MTFFRSISTLITTAFVILLCSRQGIAETISTAAINENITSTLLPAITIISENRWIQGTLIILITFIIASLTTWLLFKIIGAITRRTNFALDDKIAALLHPPLYYTLVVLGINAGLDLMPLSDNLRI
jgi:MscS family membrane protein